MIDFKNLIHEGIVNDLFKAEKARAVIRIISKWKDEIEKKGESHIATYSHLQTIARNEYIMSISRLSERPSNKKDNRCLRRLFNLMISSSEEFPDVRETYQTELHLKVYNLNSALTQLLYSNDNKNFTMALGSSFLTEFEHHLPVRKIIRSWRNEIIAHNDSTIKNYKLHFTESDELLELGWKVVTLIGWAYMNTVYGLYDDIQLRDDARRIYYHMDSVFSEQYPEI